MRTGVRIPFTATVLGAWCIILLAGAASCGKEQEAERLKNQLDDLEKFIKTKADTVYHEGDLRFAPSKPGRPMAPEEGQAVQLRYVLFMLKGQTATPLETNDTAWAKAYNLRVLPGNQGPLRYVYGHTKAFKGLEMGLQAFAQQNGEGWLGIPSYLAFSKSKLGAVKPHTPLLCLWHLSPATPQSGQGE